MKKFNLTLILIALGIMFSVGVTAQLPPKPPSDPTSGGNQNPAGPTGSPIEPGTGILLILAAGYSLKKVYEVRKKPLEEL
jgi:hypothetical protein